jgi:hypothetical protein
MGKKENTQVFEDMVEDDYLSCIKCNGLIHIDDLKTHQAEHGKNCSSLSWPEILDFYEERQH